MTRPRWQTFPVFQLSVLITGSALFWVPYYLDFSRGSDWDAAAAVYASFAFSAYGLIWWGRSKTTSQSRWLLLVLIAWAILVSLQIKTYLFGYFPQVFNYTAALSIESLLTLLTPLIAWLFVLLYWFELSNVLNNKQRLHATFKPSTLNQLLLALVILALHIGFWSWAMAINDQMLLLMDQKHFDTTRSTAIDSQRKLLMLLYLMSLVLFLVACILTRVMISKTLTFLFVFSYTYVMYELIRYTPEMYDHDYLHVFLFSSLLIVLLVMSGNRNRRVFFLTRAPDSQ